MIVERADASRLGDVESLWLALHEDHARVASHLGPTAEFRADSDSWERRSRQYEAYLAPGSSGSSGSSGGPGDSRSALFLASDGSTTIGYALAHVRQGGPTLVTEELVHLESLSVLPEARGQGAGKKLIEAVWAWARQLGIEHLTVNVMAGNLRAEQLYRKLGFVPLNSTLITRLPSRPADG